jgi:hypothetical protein
MRSGILRARVAALRLNPAAPWPSQIAEAHRALCAIRLQSGPMNTAKATAENCPVSAPSTGQILPFPVAACRNLSK